MNKEQLHAKKVAKRNKKIKHYKLMQNHEKRRNVMTRTMLRNAFLFQKLMNKREREKKL